MTPRRRSAIVGVVVLVACSAWAVAAQPVTNDIVVRSSIDRTALFVGDRATFAVELTCKAGVEILADDLSRDKLKLEGLEVVDGTTDRRSGPDGGTIYTFRFVVTTYRIDAPVLRIAPLTVRYAVRRAGQRLEDAAPAGEEQVPGVVLALRSVLPDEPDLAGIRADKAPDARAPRFTALQAIGIGLIIVSIVPALAAMAPLARRVRQPRVRRSAKVVRQEERASLSTVRGMDVDTPDRRREVFTRLEALVRQHLTDTYGVAGAGLTPSEVPGALATTRATVAADVVQTVLTTCELARYAPWDAMPSADVCRQTIEHVEQIVA